MIRKIFVVGHVIAVMNFQTRSKVYLKLLHMVKGSKMNGKKKAVVVLIICFAASILISSLCYQTDDKKVYVEIQKVGYEDLNHSISVSGEVVSGSYECVYSASNLRVKKVYVKEGDEVKKGDLICVYDEEELKKEIDALTERIENERKINTLYKERMKEQKKYVREQKKIQVKEVFQQLCSKEKQYHYENELRQSLYEKINGCKNKMKKCTGTEPHAKLSEQKKNYVDLYEKVNKKIEEIESQIKLLKKQYKRLLKNESHKIKKENNSLESSIRKLEKQRKKLEKQRKQVLVLAPKSGIITEVYVTEGVHNNVGKVALIHIKKQVKIKAHVSGTDIFSVKKGMKVKIIDGVNQYRNCMGTVENVSHAVSESGYEIEIISNAMKNAIVGENVAVQILLSEAENVLAISYDGVAQDESGQDYVYMIERVSGNKCRLKKVGIKKGLESNYYIEILSENIKNGDYIVCNPEQYSENETVFIKE